MIEQKAMEDLRTKSKSCLFEECFLIQKFQVKYLLVQNKMSSAQRKLSKQIQIGETAWQMEFDSRHLARLEHPEPAESLKVQKRSLSQSSSAGAATILSSTMKADMAKSKMKAKMILRHIKIIGICARSRGTKESKT
jgi:hypothetical protein